MIRIEDMRGVPVAFADGCHILEEAASYIVCGADAVHWNGVALSRVDVQRFQLPLDFSVGRISLDCTIGGDEKTSEIEVIPSSKKLSPNLWLRMLVDLETWLPGVTVGDSKVGHGGVALKGVSSPLLAEALLPLLSLLLDATRILCERLRHRRGTNMEDLPIHAARTVRSETVRWIARHPDVAKALRGDSAGGRPPILPLRVAVEDLEHPANRYIAWELDQVVRVLTNIAQRIRESSKDGGDDLAWFTARVAKLNDAANKLRSLVRRSPLATVARLPDATAAMATIFDDPVYSRVHSLCRRFLAPMFALAIDEPPARTRPSYGIYELWCLLALRNALRSLSGFRWTESGIGELLKPSSTGGGAVIRGQSDDGELELCFNATFASYHVRNETGKRRSRWSLSSERRPDFAIAWRSSTTPSFGRWIVLDAKYRADLDNLAKSMESLHIYRDALRWEGHDDHAGGGLILAPSSRGAEIYFGDEYLTLFGLGMKVARPGEAMNPILDWAMTTLGAGLRD